MKQLLKLIFQHFLLITFIMTFSLGIVGLFDRDVWPWYMPFELIAMAAITSLGSVIFYNKTELTKKQFLVRVILHFILLVSVELGLGYLFKWWSHWDGILINLGIFLIIYVSVWVITAIQDHHSSERINKALKNKQNEEKDEK